jgi:hypothetical protein
VPSDGLNVKNRMKPATVQRSRERSDPRMARQVAGNWPVSLRTRGSRIAKQAITSEMVGNRAERKKARCSSPRSERAPPATPTATAAV